MENNEPLLFEASKIIKLIELENKMVIVKSWGEEKDFRGHHMLFYPECNGKQLKVFKDRSDSFQLMVLKYDSCVKNRLKWGTQIGVA